MPFALRQAMAEVQANPTLTDVEKSADPEITPASDGDKKSPPKSKRLLYMLAALVVAAAGIYVWFHAHASTSSAPSAAAAAETTLPLETFVVNLNGAGQRAYLRVGITLGLSRPLPHNANREPPVALLRDAILSVLASAQPEQLLTSDGKQKLKTDLLNALQERAPELGIENVYFTEFLVQM